MVFKLPSHGFRWRGFWVLLMTLLSKCYLAAGLLDVKKKSASFVRGRISGINYGPCDSWLTRPCWQRLTFAHCILQIKSSVSQKDHLFSVISADHNTAEKHSSTVPCQGGQITPSAGMKSSLQFLNLIPFYVWMIHNGVISRFWDI